MATVSSKINKPSKKAVPSHKTYIHPTAIVSPEAMIGAGVEIGPYCVVGPKVRIGAGTRLFGNVIVDGNTEIGERCKIFPGAVLGMPGQTRKPERADSRVVIGADNIIREYVTIHAGMEDGSKTVIGDRNILMAYAHVAHDCILGSDISLANAATLAGHVQVEDRVVLGGLVGVHQFVRIGRLAIVGGLSKVVMDVPPYSMYDGHPAAFRGVNSVGLKRAGYTSSQLQRIKKVLVALFDGRVNISHVIPVLQKDYKSDRDIQAIFNFIKASKRGIGRASSKDPSDKA